MRVVILGAGIIGVTAAWECLRDGHQVTLVDRAAEPASFASHANAGLIAPGHSYAWASPHSPRIMLQSLWRNDQAIRFHPAVNPAQWGWIMRFLRQCTEARTAINTRRKTRLCIYSQARFAEVIAETGFEFAHNSGGLIYFYRSQKTFDAAAEKSDILRNEGLDIQSLDRTALVARDPGLVDARDHIAGGLFVPTDESGDARLFALALTQKCREGGARLCMQTSVTGLATNGGQISAVQTSGGTLEGDAFVIALGVFSPHLVKRLGLKLPIYPVKGYSVTLPVDARHRPPLLGGLDEDNWLAYCPMDKRFRITATAKIGNYNTDHRPSDFKRMLSTTREILPRAADYSAPEYWAGLRPMTPTGLPVVGKTHWGNLWLNTGHGHMGWTMACGSARILADLLGNKTPEIPLDGINPAIMGGH
jgi:D-amino-acid dehydrogenase